MGQKETAVSGKNRDAGEVLSISIPRTECAVVRHFQERMPYGLLLPDIDDTGVGHA
jgi:hypothetical protein